MAVPISRNAGDPQNDGPFAPAEDSPTEHRTRKKKRIRREVFASKKKKSFKKPRA